MRKDTRHTGNIEFPRAFEQRVVRSYNNVEQCGMTLVVPVIVEQA